MDTRLKRSTTFHAQTYGQTEMVNRTVIHLLRGYCGKHMKTWDGHLFYVQHAYNRDVHTSTGKSPFKTCFRYLPRSPIDMAFAFPSTAADSNLLKQEERARLFVERIKLIQQTVQEQLEKSQLQYKQHHDKHRVYHKFQVGDQVWGCISTENECRG